MNDLGMNLLLAFGAIVLGYLFGSIPMGVIIGKVFYHKDPRDYGSGNSGGTNAGRVFGKKAGAAVILLDMLKVLIPFYAFWAILAFSGVNTAYDIFDDGVLYLWMLPLFGTLGHCFPFYLRFKGGKAVACYFGIIGGTSYVSLAFAVISFLSFLKGKKMVSFASVFAGALNLFFVVTMAILDYSLFDTSILFFNFGVGGLLHFGWEMALCLALMYVLLVVRHTANLKRIKAGNENKISWLK